MKQISRLGTFWTHSLTTLLAVQLLVLGAYTGTVLAAQDTIRLAALESADKGEVAPDFDLKDLNGSSVRLSGFKGNKPVLLYFWATWCPYCIQAKPEIAKLREKMGASEMEVLGINVGEGDSFERVKKYQQGHPVAWPILYDEGSKISRAYKVQGIPLFVLVDKSGKIAYRSNAVPTDLKQYLK